MAAHFETVPNEPKGLFTLKYILDYCGLFVLGGTILIFYMYIQDVMSGMLVVFLQSSSAALIPVNKHCHLFPLNLVNT